MRLRLFLTALCLATPTWAADVVFVSVAGEKRIAVFKMDDDSGHLTAAGSIATTGEPGALIADPKRRFLFAAMRSTGELAAFRIDPADGRLKHINTVPAGADPAHISTDRAGRSLLTAYYVAGQVTVHAIAEDGALSKQPRQTVKTKEKAHAIVLDPTGMAALVPHTGPNVIYTFWWNGKKGGELAVPFWPARFATPKNAGPRHVVFHPMRIAGGVDAEAQVAYVANEQGGSVTMYHAILNPINWLLAPQQTISTLSAGFRGANACAEIRLHPSGNFLYVSNRGHDSIAAFAIDRATGRLTSLGQTATEKTPRSFDLSPSGKFLFAAGESSGRLALYRVDAAAGKLERRATYDIGKMPWWVMALRLPAE
jgi:6-phosphogluconolactonase